MPFPATSAYTFLTRALAMSFGVGVQIVLAKKVTVWAEHFKGIRPRDRLSPEIVDLGRYGLQMVNIYAFWITTKMVDMPTWRYGPATQLHGNTMGHFVGAIHPYNAVSVYEGTSPRQASVLSGSPDFFPEPVLHRSLLRCH